RELALYSETLAGKPQIVAANKVDLPDARARAKKLATALKRKKVPVFLVSSATGEGVSELMDAVAERIFAGR
ncbi:MAG: GTPase ObgE, partial [Deltaproteobacteria bacterium]|nr:GTPase ObgE [Deltaproteobacteria bacterium]